MHDDMQFRLVSAFPASADAELIRAFREGILIADGLIEAEPLLGTVIGHDLRGHLRRAGILFRIHELCRIGDLPFEAKMSLMPRGSWHWLELLSGPFVAHVCRTEGPMAFPEDTLTRQDERFLNQNDLFEPNFVPLREVAESSSELCAWLTFGGVAAGQLQHLCWAMPAADGRDWLGHINVLKRAAASGLVSESEARESKSLGLRFKEHIEEALSRQPSGGSR